uniref:Transmembrane protein 198 n=1 Tax=Sphenodon punctatus TaxID=8508 RepID=A0A8D0H5G0_SPHPU
MEERSPALLPLVLTTDPQGFNQGAMEPGVVPCLVCALCSIFGVVYCCFGYRCFKAIMFLSGLLFGVAVIFLLCYKEWTLEMQLSLKRS